MSYREAKNFLANHTRLVELTDEAGGRVAVCPEWQGRVMTSTCAGMDGPSFGFVHRDFIEAGKLDPVFNNYGGEDRMWLSPEGGQFSLWFKPGRQQTMENWFTPAAINEGAWTVASAAGEPECRMTTQMKFQNASATGFDLKVDRVVRLLRADDLEGLFGEPAAAMAGRGAQTVAYETVNKITNRGDAWTEQKGLVSIWILGMLNSGPATVVIVPYEPGDESQLGPVVKSDYFGPVPPERLEILPRAVLFAADGRYRAKIGTSQRRARSVLGSIDFDAGVLTLVRFSMPADPAGHHYMNNMWGGPHADPYTGDVANSYNDGPNELGRQLGAFYEVESLSPAVALEPGQSLEHRHRTVHVQAGPDTLNRLAREILGVELDTVRKEMPGGYEQ